MNLDTTFLIDLHKELGGGKSKGALQFLKEHPKARFHISVVVSMEYLEGFSDIAKGGQGLAPFKQIVFDEQTARIAANIRRTLRKQGSIIGDLDILIAATALQMGEPLVTANEDHFNRVNGLKCISYRT